MHLTPALRRFDRTRRIAAVLVLVLFPSVLLAQMTGRIGPTPPPTTNPTPAPTPTPVPPSGPKPDPVAKPAPAEQAKDIYGNYYVEVRDFPDPGAVSRSRLTLRREHMAALPDPARNGLQAMMPDETSPLVAYGTENNSTRGGRVGNKVRLEYFGGTKVELQQVGPDELRGQWHYRNKQGPESLRRSQPSITDVNFESEVKDTVVRGIPGRVQIAYRDDWNQEGMSNGNRPSFWVTVYGTELWGLPDLRVLEGPGLSPGRTGGINFIDAKGESSREWRHFNDGAAVAGMKIEVLILPGTTPGRKVISVHGIPITLDLLIPGYPKGPDAFPPRPGPSLRFVKMTGTKFTPIEGGVAPGDTVSVEARYEEPPTSDTAEVTLEWAEGSRKVTVHRTPESRNLYRSFPITLSTTQGTGRPDR